MPRFESQKQINHEYLHSSQLNYQEIISILDNLWTTSLPTSIKKINAFLGNPVANLSTILIAGTSGKSTTIHYLSKLLLTEGLKIGIVTSPHFNTYNERISINGKNISNEVFTQLANEILDIIKTHQIHASSKDILIAIAALYFKQECVDLTIIEQENSRDFDPSSIFNPIILGITRVVLPNTNLIHKTIDNISISISPKTSVVSADQSKITLQYLAQKTEAAQGIWIMPIRKTAPLPYPFEQLHGRCAALAERIADSYIKTFLSTSSTSFSTTSILRLIKKQRGRPSLTTKKQSSPSLPTIESFWKSITIDNSYRFEIIENKHYTLVLDVAANIDALQNLLLGIRLLNYKKSFKSITFLLGCHQEQLCEEEFIKAARYFFKKLPSSLILCPISNTIGEQAGIAWNVEKSALLAQHAKIKVFVYKNFKNAYESAIKQMHDSQDLFVITGSQAIVSEYFKYKKAKDSV